MSYLPCTSSNVSDLCIRFQINTRVKKKTLRQLEKMVPLIQSVGLYYAVTVDGNVIGYIPNLAIARQSLFNMYWSSLVVDGGAISPVQCTWTMVMRGCSGKKQSSKVSGVTEEHTNYMGWCHWSG